MFSKKILLNITISLIFGVLIGTPLFYLRSSVHPHIFPKTLFFQCAVEVLFAVWLALAVSDARYRPKRTPLLAAGAGFIGILTLTSLFGVDFHRSFWSTCERMLGIFTILHLAGFAIVLSSLYKEIPLKKILGVSLAAAALVSSLAILQKKMPCSLLDEIADRPGSTFGNPAFMAGYLLFNIFIGCYLLLDGFAPSKQSYGYTDQNNRLFPTLKQASVILFTLFCVIAFFLAETRGDILGLWAGFVILLIAVVGRPPPALGMLSSRRPYAVLLLILVLVGPLFWLTRQDGLWESVPGLRRFRGVSFSLSDSDPSLPPRLVAIRAAWKGFLERPLTGFGWENFNVAYNKQYDPRALEVTYQESRFDKPHNFVLEDLVSGGVPLLLARIALFALFLWQALKTKSLFGRFAVAAVAGLVVRNIFIFDTLGPALMFYTFLGLIDGEYKEASYTRATQYPMNGNNRQSGQTGQNGTFSPYLLIPIVAGMIAAFMFNIPGMKASYYEFFGIKWFHSNPTRAIAYFDKALVEWSPYRWNFARDFAAAVSEASFYNPGSVKKEDAFRSIQEMERVARDHSADVYHHSALVDLYNQVSDMDPEKFLAAAEREANIALELSPNMQTLYFSAAKTQSLRGDHLGAIELLKRARDLDPKVADAHFYYGLLLSANKDIEGGYKELKIAISLGKQWRIFYEPRVVADYFADAGHLDEAIVLYKKALELYPDDLEATLKIGMACFYTGNYPAARGYLSEVATKADFTKGPAYDSLRPILDRLGVPVGVR